ncbi:RNA polymerase factor sigma-54 [Rhodomicrobium sp. R_RK_3]|uniref:RNA polymerase factor sigma-54 n=1 Tax=Rhodomicrobium TaxID=1068 RepID=UPI0032AF71A7
MLQTKLELRQTQSLVITPQLQQAIKLLQLSNLELHSFLEREIEQNPLIDWDERAGDETPRLTAATAEAPAETAPAGAETLPGEGFGGEDVHHAAGPADEMSDFADDAAMPPPAAYENLSLRSSGNGLSEPGAARFEDYTAEQVTLRDHLRQQLHLAVADPTRRLIGDHLVDLIDEAGYLRGTVEEVAERLGAPSRLIESVLAEIQSFDPIGVGARSLEECLALQLKECNRYDPAIAKLLGNLDLLAAHDLPKLRRLCEVDHEDLLDMIAEIRALNPKPGLQFGFAAVEAVVPDILVTADADGAWKVQLNSDTLPRICINHGFYATAKRQVRNERDKHYLQGCISTANWLARSLDQRRRTMLKVAREIVRQQDGFLSHGVRGLKPLGLKDVADRIGMHESTVSRVTSNKYMQTPRGTFELKYFFTSAIAAAGFGDAHSSEAVKHRIKEMIDNESPRRILSDDKIVAMLRDDGIDIARRTVAKYRELMRIPSSVQRRRNKNAAASRALVTAKG